MVCTRRRGKRARPIMIEINQPIWTQLQLVESRDPDGILRIALVGELDLAVAGRISSRLDQLADGWTRARVDLSRLEFMDLSGARTLIRAVQHRNQHRERLIEIAHDTTPIVRRVIDLIGAGPVLWPTNHSLG